MQLKTGCIPESAHLNSLTRDRNREVRRQLAKSEASHPGITHHSDRVAVYVVAVAERMGYDLDTLVTLRIAAQVHDIEPDRDLDELLKTLIRLSEAFDNRLRGFHGEPKLTEAEALLWLETDAEKEYGPQLTRGLAAVHNLIQPVELEKPD